MAALVALWGLGCAGEVGEPLGVDPTPGPTSYPPRGTPVPGGPVTPAPAPSGGTPSAVPPAMGGGPACAGGSLPAEVAQTLAVRCLTCHGNPPLAGVPGSLARYDDLLRPAKTDPTRTMAEAALARIAASPPLRMPPAPADPLTARETQTLSSWINAGMPLSGCAPAGTPPPDGGVAPAPAGPDPFAAPARCTSGQMWNRGTRGSPLMQPGEACNACHSRGEGPQLAFGGTVYPSGHEPSLCNGASTGGAQVIVTDASGASFTAQVNEAGNFFLRSRTRITPPLKARVVSGGRERAMVSAVTSGDCNTCHTQAGTTTAGGGALKAPGRIALP
jgi:hypothetical protein